MIDLEIPNNLLTGAISLVFYLVLAVFILSSAIAVYSLVRYGKGRVAVVGISFAYILAAFALTGIALGQFHQIQF
jgi:hypothetical protein